MLETNFSEHNKIWGTQKRFGGNCPRMPVCSGLSRTVARKSSIGHRHVCARGLDILKIYFLIHNMNSIWEIVQINYKYFPANTHNRLVVSNLNFSNQFNKRNWDVNQCHLIDGDYLEMQWWNANVKNLQRIRINSIVQLSKNYCRRSKHEADQSMCAAMNVFFH